MTNQRLLCCSDGAAAIAGLANQVMNINESGTVLRKKMLRAAKLTSARLYQPPFSRYRPIALVVPFVTPSARSVLNTVDKTGLCFIERDDENQVLLHCATSRNKPVL